MLWKDVENRLYNTEVLFNIKDRDWKLREAKQ